MQRYALIFLATIRNCGDAYLGFDEGTTLVKGVHYTLRWNIKHVSEVYINGQSVSPSNRAYKVINNDLGFKTFTLLVVNGIKQKSASVNVEVVSGAVIEISSSKNKLRQGKEDKVEISWDISHAKSAILKYDNVERAISLKGKLNIECLAVTIQRMPAQFLFLMVISIMSLV